MKHESDKTLVELDLLDAERLLTTPLKTGDPGKEDFSEEFFNSLHDKIMSRVEELEIQPRPRVPRPLFPRSWRKTGSAILGCLVLSALAPTMTTQVEIKIPNKSDQLFQAALDSPENFEILIADNDFLVDVATRKFDHLNIKEIDDILGTTVSDNQSLWNSP